MTVNELIREHLTVPFLGGVVAEVLTLETLAGLIGEIDVVDALERALAYVKSIEGGA